MLTGLGLTARELFRKAGWAAGPGSTVQEAQLLQSLAHIWGAAVRLQVVNPAGAVSLQVLLAVLEWSKQTLQYQQTLAAAVATTAPLAQPTASQQPPPHPLQHLQHLQRQAATQPQQLLQQQQQPQPEQQQEKPQEPKPALQLSQQPQSAPEARQPQPHPQQQQREPPVLLLQQQQQLLEHLMANSEEKPLKRPKQAQAQQQGQQGQQGQQAAAKQQAAQQPQQQQAELQSLARSLLHTLAGLEAAAGGSTGTATVSAGLPSGSGAHLGGGDGAADGSPGVIAESEALLRSGSSNESKCTKVRPPARPPPRPPAQTTPCPSPLLRAASSTPVLLRIKRGSQQAGLPLCQLSG